MKNIKIGGITYTHTFVQDARMVHPNPNEGNPLWGITDFMTCSIRQVDSDIPGISSVTFLHELVHVIISEYCIDKLKDDKGNHNEDAVDLLAKGFNDALTSLDIDIVKVLKRR